MSDLEPSAGSDAGLSVFVSGALPIPVSPGEQARRIVRHGLADVLGWLGEPIGPGPSDQTHAIRDRSKLFVSAHMYEQLRLLPRGKTVGWDFPVPPVSQEDSNE